MVVYLKIWYVIRWMLNSGVNNISIDMAQSLEQAEVTVILLAIGSGPTKLLTDPNGHNTHTQTSHQCGWQTVVSAGEHFL